jgi:hypothetical protein
MKRRTGIPGHAEADEKELTESIHALLQRLSDAPPAGPPDAYWQNLILRTNARIDEATSGKAIMMSWFARVAVPGVVAILSFVVGLHYYAPESPNQRSSLTAVVLSLPGRTMDSLLLDPSQLASSLSVQDVGTDPFDLPKEQIADYFIETGKATSLLEGLTDQQVSDVLTILGTNPD